ncbi:MAG: hypothetical protein ACOX3Y_06560 [Clostridia bacterium]
MNLSKRELVLTGLVVVLLAVNAGLILKYRQRRQRGCICKGTGQLLC